MSKINILHLITGLGIGGAEKIVIELYKHINNDEFKSVIVSLSKRKEILDLYKNDKIEATTLNLEKKEILKSISIINKIIKKNNINIIHAHMFHSIVIAAILKIFNPSIKIISTTHNYNLKSKLREYILFLLKFLRDVDIIFDKNMKKFYYIDNCKIIPNGIDVKKYNIKTKKFDKFTFINIGRLEKQKNQEFLIDLFYKIDGKISKDYQLLIVGDGENREELENKIKKYNMEKKIKLLGIRKDIPELLNKSHCFILSSLWEGLPIVVLEAGATGLPVITSDVGSLKSIINDENGYIGKLENFENLILDVLNNYDKAIEKGNKLKRLIYEKYSLDNMIKKHKELYKNIINVK